MGIVALRDFSLEIEEGGFVSVLGRSGCGCGKSTMLNLLAGLTRPTSGVVPYRDEPLTRPRVEMGYLTQSDTLMPWRDVRRNIEMSMVPVPRPPLRWTSGSARSVAGRSGSPGPAAARRPWVH